MDSHLVIRNDDRSIATTDRILDWVLRGSLRSHVLLLALVLVAVGFLVRPGDVWTADEGAIRSQAELLATTGSWSTDRPFADIDPEGILAPIHGASIEGDRYFPFTKQPLIPVLLAVPASIASGPALIAVSLLGALGAALSAALIATRIGPNLPNLALWAVGLFTPTLFYGYTVLGHTVAAACAGFVTLLVMRHRDRPSPWWVPIGLLAALAVLMRAEAMLYALALAVAIVIVAPEGGRRRRAGLGLVLVGSALGAVVVNSVADAALGGPTPEEGEAILDAFRVLSGAFSSLILVDFGPPLLTAAVMAMLASAALLAVAVDREPRNVAFHRVLLVIGLVACVGLLVLMPVAVGGLLAATPFLLCGILVMGKRLRSEPDVAVILVAAAAYLVMVIATQERGGGGAQWGGRYLLLMVPALAPVAIAGLAELHARRPSASRPLFWLLGCASIVLAIGTVWTLNAGRANSVLMVDRLVTTAVAASEQGPASTPMMMSTHTQIGRHAWNRLDEVAFLLIPEDRLDTYVERLAATSDASFGYFGSLDASGPVLEGAGYAVQPFTWHPYFIVSRPDG